MHLLTVTVKNEYDILLARQKAKRITTLAGLPDTDQTRFITSVSEVARNVFSPVGGKIEFLLYVKEFEQSIQARIFSACSSHQDNRAEELLNRVDHQIRSSGIVNLVKYHGVICLDGCCVATLSKGIPPIPQNSVITTVDQWISILMNESPQSFYEEIQQQNHLLLTMLEQLEKQDVKMKLQLEETERLNRELADFAHIISHDLKAPLRAIKSLAGWIVNDYRDKLDEDGKQMLDLLSKRIIRLNCLVDGLLQYSKISHSFEEISFVDVQQIINEMLSMLHVPEHIQITVENILSKLPMEEIKVLQIFQNLVSNAIKYMDKPLGRIRIGCEDGIDHWLFYIADNGPGIEKKHFMDVFTIFYTGNNREDTESTGVGLTIVKKIVQLYGGIIWLESEMGQGSTFYFKLPKEIKGF